MSIPAGVPLSEIPSLSPPPGAIPNFNNPPTIGPTLIAVDGVFLALMVVAVSIRMYCKGILLRLLGWDDYTCLLASAGAIADTGVIIEQIEHGFGRHLWDIPLSVLTNSDVRVLNAANVIGQPTVLLIKLSIMLLYLRIFAVEQTMRYLLWGGIGIQVVVYTATTACAIADVFLCTAESAHRISFCVNEYKVGLFQVVFTFATDLYVLILPIKPVLGLQLSPRRKIGVMILFGTGLLACVASLVRLIATIQQKQLRDSTYQGAWISIFGCVEIKTGIIASSLTVLPTFVKKSGIASFTFSTLESLRSRFFTRNKDSPDHGYAISSSPLKRPFGKSDVNLDDDSYIKLEEIKVTFMDKSQYNASHNDVGMHHSTRGIFRTDEFDVAYSGNGRMEENNGR